MPQDLQLLWCLLAHQRVLLLQAVHEPSAAGFYQLPKAAIYPLQQLLPAALAAVQLPCAPLMQLDLQAIEMETQAEMPTGLHLVTEFELVVVPESQPEAEMMRK